VTLLHRWGLLDRLVAAGTPALRTTTFHYGDESVTVRIKPRDGVDALYAPRRTLLDALLADAARESGAEVVYGARVVDLLRREGGRVAGVVVEDATRAQQRIEADVVIGADGVRSTVAGLVGAPVLKAGRHASGVLYGFWEGLDQDGFHWHFAPRTGAGCIPTNDGLTLVFTGASERRFREEMRFDRDASHLRLLRECSPALAEAVARARQVGSLRGFAGVTGFVRRSHGPGWALVGDASYFKDPITAHGITDALRDAELLACAVAEGSNEALAGYQETRDALSAGLFEVTDEIASYAWDLSAVKQMHLVLSKEMNREVEHLLQLDRDESRVALRTA
jgi:2-polyprenyl-6-methoxyphenol hydroxylase-like FAD-dependent oxidoreductase